MGSDKYYLIQSGEIGIIKVNNPLDRIYKVLSENNSFSTFELLYKLPKNCVLKCLTDVVVFFFNRESLTYAKRMAAQTKRKVLQETISRLDFFEPLDFEQKDKLIDILEERDFVLGDDVQMHSVPFSGFFILYEGKVGVVHSTMPGLDNFSSKKFKTLQSGDFIGEKALFSNLAISNEQFVVQSEFATVFCLKKATFENSFEPMSKILRMRVDLLEKYNS